MWHMCLPRETGAGTGADAENSGATPFHINPLASCEISPEEANMKSSAAIIQWLNRQLQQCILNNGVTIPYAAGVFILNDGHKSISHDGVGAGFTAFNEYYPQLGLSFVLMSNTSNLNAYNICKQVEGLFIKPVRILSNNVNDPVVDLSDDQLRRYEGWYANTRTAAGLLITVKNNYLMSNNGDTLKAISPAKFQIGKNLLVFPDTIRSDAKFIISGFYPDTILLHAVSPPPNDVKKLAGYTGEYFCEELKSSVTVLLANDSVYLQLPGGKTYKLKPQYKHGFVLEPSIIASSPTYLVFEHKNGSVNGIRITVYRSRNVLFKKST